MYALTVGGAMIDRGRIWSWAAGPALYDGLLHPMEDDIQDELEGAGLLDLGMTDRDDEPFEVVIDVEGVEELMGAPENAIQSKELSERDRTIRDRLHWLRHEDPERFARVGVELQQAGFTTNPDDLGHFFLTEHNDEEQTYAFNNQQLDQIEQIIDDTE